VVFDAPHHPCHDGEARVCRQRAEGRRQGVFSLFFSLSPPRKVCWPLQKKKKSLTICLLS